MELHHKVTPLRLTGLAACVALLGFTLQRCYMPIELHGREYWKKIPEAQTFLAGDSGKIAFSDKNKSELALHYLKLANLNVLRKIEPGPASDLINDISDKGDCMQYAHFTYSNFLYIIKEAGFPELDRYVRMSIGYEVSNKESYGHAWLEFKKDGNWLPYETTFDNFDRYFSFEAESIDSILATEILLDNKTLKFQPIYSMQATDCEVKCNITEEFNFLNSLLHEGKFELYLKQRIPSIIP